MLTNDIVSFEKLDPDRWFCHLKGRDTLGRLSAGFYKRYNFYDFNSCTLNSFWKGIYSKSSKSIIVRGQNDVDRVAYPARVSIPLKVYETPNFSHYENTPIPIYRKFHLQKTENFQIKNSDIFHISAQNIDCGYSLEPPRRGGSNEYSQSMFLSRNKKDNVYPCKPQFYYIKVGFKGVKII